MDRKIADFLMSDELLELSERLKTGDGLLDLINLTEVQHSQILSWMFDPREGHGQGDAILRDLLSHASVSALERSASGDGTLDQNGKTARFFSKWTPAKIRTTGFGGCFIATEFSEQQSEKFDLLIVDPVNKFIVVIENKTKATIDLNQLQRYRGVVEGWLSRGSRYEWFHDFDLALVVLDKNFEWAEINKTNNELYRWATVNYEWLKQAANRSTLHLERGNVAAKLLQNYCRQQVDWQSANDSACTRLAAKLWLDHREVVDALCQMTPRPDKAWILGQVAEDKVHSDLQAYAVQNRDVLKALVEAKGFAAVKHELYRQIPNLPKEQVIHARVWLDFVPSVLAKLAAPDADYWPMYFNVRTIDESHCVIRFVSDHTHLSGRYDGDDLRKWANKFAPGMEIFQNSVIRRVTLEKKIAYKDVPGVLVRWEQTVTRYVKDNPFQRRG